ncbi:aldehyde dehydrogenase family protein [Brevibacillus ginsengisoli]|uniref:aldehyde dehydrogenase family protein n=1 Tax=Brevibacillus ginsengisoli TaxID=363854 RepID=UPI003CECCC3F
MQQPTVNHKWQVTCPATLQVIAEIEETPIEAVPEMFAQAREAFGSWSALSLRERIHYLRRLRLYMADHMEEIVQTISNDTGKVKVDALVADILPILDALEHIEKHAPRILMKQKQSTPILLIGKSSYIEYMPRGVVLVISPWNYPLHLAMMPIISALVSGNTVILKPSEITPLVGLLVQQLFERVGFPNGVVQVAHGGKELGAALTQGKPDYIFFTGSVRTGQIIQAQAAKDLIPTTLELGGKDPMIVFADANLKRAVKGALWGAFTNSGQVCMSTERLYVERSIYDRFVSRLIDEVNQLNQGFGPDDDVGSMTSPAQLLIIKEQLEEALALGAELRTGSAPAEWKTDQGLFLPPTVLTNVKQSMKVVQEESFGPLLPVIPFDTEEEAIALANDSVYGLNASVWSGDLTKAKRVSSRLVSGAVAINDVLVTVANHNLPFGGAKQSGIGRYHGEGGLRIFCHEKAVVIDPGTKRSEVHWYPYKGKYHLLYNLIYSYYGKTRNWFTFAKTYLKLLRKS